MALSDDLFQAVDTIVQARIANLPYDQTIECEIIDDSKAKTGEYQVQHQAAKFTAFGSPSVYKNEDVVYVSIPKGDYKENKFIVNKKNSGDFTQIKALPFSKFIKGENLFSTNKTEFSIPLNSGKTIDHIFTYDKRNINYNGAGFTRLGIKCAINSDIRNEMLSGNYGIQISLVGYDQTSTYLDCTTALKPESGIKIEKILTLGINDMVGANLYNTYGYCNQEKVFDIANFYIESATMSLFQDDNFITSSGDKIVEKRVFFKNIQLFLGYDSSECVEKGKQQIILYTEDGLLYNSNFLTKTAKTRIIEILQNNTYKIITDYSEGYYQGLFNYYWEQYNVETENQNSVSQLPNYTIFSNEKKLEQTFILPNARNRMQAGYVLVIQSIGTINTKMVSNELLFTNSAYLPDSEVVDIIMGFSAAVEDDYDGKYFIYGQDSKIIDITVAALPHYITLRYNPISEDQNNRGFQVGDIITWKIPRNKTMLLPYKIGQDKETKNLDYIIYEHVITNTDLGNSQEKIFKVPFLIRDYYTPSDSNNTIELSMTRLNLTFTTKQELTFGTSGSQGGEYIVYIKLTEYSNNNNNNDNSKQIFSIPVQTSSSYQCQAVAQVYDYKNSLININKNNIYWELLKKIEDTDITINNEGILSFPNKGMEYYKKHPVVLKCTIKIGGNNIEGYYAIPYSNTELANGYIANGSTLLTYDITGKKPFFTKTKFQLNDTANVKWSIIPDNEDTPKVWAPKLTNNNELTGPSIFDINSSIVYYSLQATTGENDTTLWVAPIYMFQHRYPNATSYIEFNQYKINNSNIEENLAGRVSNNGGVFLGVYNGKLGLYAFGKDKNSDPLTLTAQITEDGTIILDGLDDRNNSKVIIKDATITDSTIDSSCSVVKLSVSDTGSNVKPIYFANGIPIQCNDSLAVSITGKSASSDKLNTNAGSNTKPVYFSNGVPVQCDDSLAISITGKAANADKLNTNAGSNTKPVYFSNGIPVQCNDSLAVSITGKSASSDKLNTNAGSNTKPVYFSNGVPVQCDNSLAVSITGTANTATNYNTSTGTIKTAIEDLVRRVTALETKVH